MNTSLSLFVDFVGKAGQARVSEVRSQVRARSDFDLYAEFKEAAAGVLREGVAPELLQPWIAQHVNEKRRPHYDDLVKGFTKFMPRCEGWFSIKAVDKPMGTDGGGRRYTVHVNPELHTRVDGRPMLVKLHCRKASLDLKRADIMLAMLAWAYGEQAHDERGEVATFGVLEVRTGKLVTFQEREKSVRKLLPLLPAEAAAYVALYASAPRAA